MGKLGEARSTAGLIRRVTAYEVAGFAVMLAILVVDDVADWWSSRALPRAWELAEIAAALLVAALTTIMTRRLARRIRQLEGLISVCMHCKRVRTEDSWVSIERYVSSRSAARFSHGLCPECFTREYDVSEDAESGGEVRR